MSRRRTWNSTAPDRRLSRQPGRHASNRNGFRLACPRLRKQHVEPKLQYEPLEPRHLLTIAHGVLVGGDLETRQFSEGDQPVFIIRFDDLTPDAHSATIRIGSGPEQQIIVQQARHNSAVFVENYFFDGTGAIEFDQDGQQLVDIRLNRSDGTLVGNFTHTLNVANTIPELNLKATSPLSDTDHPVELSFHIVDPGNDTATMLTIDWGDGQIEQVSDLGQPSIVHQYESRGTYTVRARVTDNDGTHPWIALFTPFHIASPNQQPATADLQIDDDIRFVNDQRFTGNVATLNNLQLPVDEYSATIYWADGQTSNGNIVPNRDGSASIRGSHIHRNSGIQDFRVEVNSLGEIPFFEAAAVKVWNVPEITYSNSESTGETFLGSFDFLAPATFEHSFFGFVAENQIPGGFEEVYRTPDADAELVYREVLGQEPEITGTIHGVAERLINRDPNNIPSANNDTVFENALGSVRVSLARNHPNRPNILRLKRATYPDEFSANVNWGDGTSNTQAQLRLGDFYHREHFMPVHTGAGSRKCRGTDVTIAPFQDQ